jgi:hypothetical protein
MSNIITIDDKEYDVLEMTATQKNILQGVQFADSKIKQLESEIGLFKESMDSLLIKLKESLEE